jgi:hypothetical protein
VHCGVPSQDNNVRRQRKTEIDMGGGNKKRFDRMVYLEICA